MPMLTVSKIAELTGIDRRTCVRRMSALPPVETRGREKHFDSAAALRAVFHADSPDRLDAAHERALYDKRRREQVEQRTAVERGSLVLKADVSKDIADACAVMLNSWESLPDRTAPLLSNVTHEQALAVLTDAVEEIQAVIADALDRLAHEPA